MEAENIVPYHYYYPTYTDYQQNLDRDTYFLFHAKKVNVDEIIKEKALFIIAEPGFGKSHLMRQLEDCITQPHQKVSFYQGREYQGIKNKEEADLILFDALDECPNPVAALNALLEYKRRTNVALIISSRSHYLQPMENILVNAEFSYLQLLRFTDEQINQFLTRHLNSEVFDEATIHRLIARSKTGRSKASPLSVPRYLQALQLDIAQRGLTPEQVEQLSKSELFDKMIYYQLDKEDADHNYKYLSRRILERISLLMEMHQVNEVSKEDFITFLDIADSNINLIFLNAGNLETFWGRDMKSIGDKLLFENTEFQEYLAAKELLRLGNRFQIIYDLLVDQQLNIIPSNWIDVLSFAIDMDPEVIQPIIAFIENNHYQNIDEQMVKIFLECKPDKLSNTFKETIFKTVMEYYRLTGRYIFDFAQRLAEFADVNDNTLLKPVYEIREITATRRHEVSNQIRLIEALAENRRLTQRQSRLWTNYLMGLVNEESLFTMRSTIFYALIALQAGPKLLSLRDLFAGKADYIYNDYLYAMSKAMPNHPQMLKALGDVLRERRRIDQLQHIVGCISQEKYLISFFRMLAAEKEMIETLSNNSGNDYHQFFETLEKKSLPKIDSVLNKFLKNVLAERRFSYHLPAFLSKTIKTAIKRKPAVLNSLLKIPYFYNWLEEIAWDLLALDDQGLIEKVESYFQQSEAHYDFERFIYRTRNYEGRDNDVTRYLSNKYPVPPSVPTSFPKKANDDLLAELRNYYIDDPIQHKPGVITYFVNMQKDLLPLLTDEDKTYIRGIVSDVIKYYDPDRFNITIDDQQPNRISFSHNSTIWFQIGQYFKTALLLGQTDVLTANREKILKSFPRLGSDYSEDGQFLKELIKVIGGLSPADIKIMLEFCLNRDDDYLLINTRPFVKQIEQFNLLSFKPLLMQFIHSGKLHSFERQETLQVFGEKASVQKDKQFLNQCFKTYSQENEPRLQEMANEFLITKFLDAKSITWRFEQLKTRLREFDGEIRYNGIRGVSEFESEMDHGKFGVCFYGINNKQITKGMLDLLNFSFLIKKNRLHFSYSAYLQQIIVNYFQSVLDQEKLELLRHTTDTYPETEQTYSFGVQLYKLYVEYHNRQRERETFTNTILKYNALLKNTYLKIGSTDELRQTLKKLMESDLLNLVENEGLYRVVRQLNGQEDTEKKKFVPSEDLIQKTLKIALEKTLLEYGFRKVDIQREVQSYDDLRYDYLVNYGLYGPVVVELKLLKSNEIQVKSQRKAYKAKLAKYVRANRNNGIYLVFQTEQNDGHLNAWNELKQEYADISGLEFCILKTY